MTKKQAISLNYAFIVIARDVHSIPDAVRPFQVCWMNGLFECSENCKQYKFNVLIFFLSFFRLLATVHLSAKEETVLLLPTAPQWELAVFAVLNGLEVWPACWLDRIDRMCGLRAGQKRRRNGQTALLLHHTAARTDRTVSVRVSPCSTRGNLEEFSPLVPGAYGDTGWAAAMLQWWVDYFLYDFCA